MKVKDILEITNCITSIAFFDNYFGRLNPFITILKPYECLEYLDKKILESEIESIKNDDILILYIKKETEK